MLVYLDMDGVIVNFFKSCFKVHKRLPPPEHEWNKWYQIQDYWELTEQEFWSPMKGFDFWNDLEWTPDGHKILEIIESYYPKDNIYLVTKQNKDPMCLAGKAAWVQREMPEYYNNLIMCRKKWAISNDFSALIDDCPENVDKYNGPKLLLPRLWNRNWQLNTLDTLKVFLDAL